MALGGFLLVAAVLAVYSGFTGKSISELVTGKTTEEDTSASSAAGTAAAGLGGKLANATRAQVLRALADVAHTQFDLQIREYPPFDPVDPVHVTNSYHYLGEAFDASGTVANMTAFAAYVASAVPDITELFWNGPGAVLLKQGKPLPPGSVAGHTDHVHVAYA